MSVYATTALRAAGMSEGDLATAVAARAQVLEMTQAAEAAVLRPRDWGSFGHDLRAAMAARIARQAGEARLAEIYLAQAGDRAGLADPAEPGAQAGLAPVLAFLDKVAGHTRHVAASDIAGLQAAGYGDADIVRLCELVAFVAYQLRLVAGLRLMAAPA